MKKITLIFIFISIISPLFSQSPTNLNSNVTASGGFSTVANTEATFNDARRQEEAQLGLAANSIKNLDLPDQTTWDGYSADQKMLFLLNDERTARAGINYGAGAVLGLPFQGVEAGVDGVADNYAETLRINDAFTHTFNGTTPSSRIDGAIPANCQEFIPYSENLHASANSAPSSFPTVIEVAAFGWNYQDAGSGWGHRKMCLYQGFTDNNGDAGQEGFIGVGLSVGDYLLFGAGFPFGAVVVLNCFDPVSTAIATANGCNFNVTVSTNSLSGGGGCPTAVTVTAANGNASVDAANTITTSGTVNVTGIVAYKAGTSITLNAEFHAKTGSTFSASIAACTALTGNDNPVETASINPLGESTISTNKEQPSLPLKEPIIYPNPFNHTFTLDYYLLKPSSVYIDVFDMRGQLVMSSLKLSNQTKGNNKLEIASENWVNGMYMVRIQVNNQVWTKRLVKQ